MRESLSCSRRLFDRPHRNMIVEDPVLGLAVGAMESIVRYVGAWETMKVNVEFSITIP
jgi:hypothetical protein